MAVDAGSVLDVTAGASLVSDGKLQGGKGGNVTLASHVLGQIPSNGGLLSFAGEVRGYGVTGGGTLSVASGGKIVLGGPLMRRTPPRCGWTRRCSAPASASTRSTATRA